MAPIYRYPDDEDPQVQKLKRLAARVGRTLYEREKHETARGKLRAFMETLGVGELDYWRRVVMIDHRWSGATGQGAFWAVASGAVNDIAADILEDRRTEWKEKYGDALFVAV